MPVILANLWLKSLFPTNVKRKESREQKGGTVDMMILRALAS